MSKCEVPMEVNFMRKEVKVVKEYWEEQSPLFDLDSETLTECVEAMETIEKEILMIGDSKTDTQQHEDFMFMINKAFNRHNDVCSGYTSIIKDEAGSYRVELTGQSSITELNIELSTLINCNRNCVYRINDITKEVLPSLQFEAIADLTGAIISSGIELD